MRSRDKECVRRILTGEPILSSEKVRFEVDISSAPKKGRLLRTKTRLLFFASAPMGMQITLVWLEDVEHLTSGKKRGMHYVQLLGQESRILVLFKSKETREAFRKSFSACMTRPMP